MNALERSGIGAVREINIRVWEMLSAGMYHSNYESDMIARLETAINLCDALLGLPATSPQEADDATD